MPAPSVFIATAGEDLLPDLIPPALVVDATPAIALKLLSSPMHPPDCVWTPESLLGPAFHSHAPPEA